MPGRIVYVPEALPLAPRPIPGELISSWLLRVSFANGLTLAQLIEAIETRFPEVSLERAFIDDQLLPRARSALANFLRVSEDKVNANELAQQFPMLPPEWILRPVNWDLGSPDRFAQGKARYAFCPFCLQEMISETRTVWIRSEWALVFQTHCARHRVPLFERCAVCFVEDPLFPITNGSPAIASCWKCGSVLLSYDPDEKASSILADVMSLESAILALTAGFPPDPRWARGSSAQAFLEKLRKLVQYLTTPADDRVPPFFRIIDADPHLRHYLFGSQRPETRVETMSWYCRFLLMMTLARQLN
ncbi:MAG: TniQ family protein [Verrucomicrobia bacterium]|nr:TniQ family protein [Verrucomicrobiota bacterium]